MAVLMAALMGRLPAPERDLPSWSFLTNHAHVLIAVSRDPDARQSEIAYAVGITVGAVQRILSQLECEGFIACEKVGRRNRYRVISEQMLRHPLENEHTVADLVESLDQ